MHAGTSTVLDGFRSSCNPRLMVQRGSCFNVGRQEKLSHRRPRVVCASSADDDLIWTQKKKLEQLFYSSDAATETETGPSPDSTLPANLLLPVILPNLPLWRVQWSMLPGLQEVLHCHVPHYCHMFESILAGPRPWCFGHVYLPGGSSNIGNPEYALEPGSKASCVGVLMHIKKAVRLRDGRLIILAQGMARIRVVEELQTVPYSRAHCIVQPDIEEKELVQGIAVESAADAVTGEVSVSNLMDYVDIIATAAAATATQTWIDWEVKSRALEWGVVMEPASDREAMRTAQLVADEGSVDVVPHLPPDLLCLSHSGSLSSPSSALLRESLETVSVSLQSSLRQTARQVAAAAFLEYSITEEEAADSTPAAPSEAEEISNEQLVHFLHSLDESIDALEQLGELAREGPFLISEEDEELLSDVVDGLEGAAALMALECRVWEELDELCVLAARLSPTAMQLTEGLLRLRPMSNEFGEQSLFGKVVPENDSSSKPCDATPPNGQRGEEQGVQRSGASGSPDNGNGVLHEEEHVTLVMPDEVAAWKLPEALLLRRAQRLSYVMTTVLADLGPKESRQAVLELPSVTNRLQVIIVALRRHRKVLAAVAALQSLGQDDDDTRL